MANETHPARLTSANVERKLVAILSADVVGYSHLMGADEVGTLRTLTASREVPDALIQQHRGRIVGTAGDSILAEFASVVNAAQCAVEIQHALHDRNANLPADQRMEFRIGVNVGDVVVEGEQIYGDGVNVAARIQSLADAGGIFLSGTVYDQIENKLSFAYEYLGEQAVKNIAKPVRIYRLRVGESLSHQVTSQKSKVESQRKRWLGVTDRAWAAVASLALIAVTLIAVRSFSPPTPSTQPPMPSTSPPLSTQDSALRTSAALTLPDKPPIVVLPFTNMSNAPEQDYFSDGITEDITTDLSKLASLFVIARNSAFTYKGKTAKIQDISGLLDEFGPCISLSGTV